MYPKSLLSH